jgi:hypothetical protein
MGKGRGMEKVKVRMVIERGAQRRKKEGKKEGSKRYIIS